MISAADFKDTLGQTHERISRAETRSLWRWEDDGGHVPPRGARRGTVKAKGKSEDRPKTQHPR